MKKIYLLTILLIAALTLVGCGGGGGNNNPGEPPVTGGGTITGSVLAPDQKTPIVGATVTAEGTGRTTSTNAQGAYTLTGIPAGQRKVIAVKGSYRAESTVTVVEGQSITAPALALASTGKIGVVEGSFDNIREILTSLGITYELIAAPEVTFANQAALSQYAVIFFECGLDDSFIYTETIQNNLITFINQGGSIYASDWAANIVETLYPDKINFAGRIGDGQSITASVTDNEIQTLLGKNTASIYFDLGAWVVINSVSSGVTVDLRGTVQTGGETKSNIPLMVHFQQGSGYVVYTSFHNEAQVTDDVIKILKHMAFEL